VTITSTLRLTSSASIAGPLKNLPCDTQNLAHRARPPRKMTPGRLDGHQV
jgi:hypothetical protein